MVEPWMKTLKFLKQYTLAALGVMILISMSPGKYLYAKDNTSDIPLRATCVDAECHPKLKTKKYKHSPVILGTCDVCHKVLKSAISLSSFQPGRNSVHSVINSD